MVFVLPELSPQVLVFIVSPVLVFFIILLCIFRINRRRRNTPTMADLRDARLEAKRLGLQPRIHEAWLEGSNKGSIDSSNGLVCATEL